MNRNPTPFHVKTIRLEDDKAVGARIRVAREEAGLDQTEFAKKLGVNPKTVSKWENGLQTTRKKYLEEIAHITGKSFAWLMVGDQPAEASRPEPNVIGSAKVRGLINRVLADIAEAGGTEEDEVWAKSVLANPFNFPVGAEKDEAQLLRDAEALASGIRAVLARRSGCGGPRA